MPNEWSPFHKLKERMDEVAAGIGVRIIGWALIPNMDPNGNGACQVVFEILPEALAAEAPPEPEEGLTEFEEDALKMIEANLQAEKQAERTRQVIERGLAISERGIFEENEENQPPPPAREGFTGMTEAEIDEYYGD